ncbi:MAG: glycosyltransferase family 39 protein [Anaerolineae bacterium]|nr:glycosyltransferase family 39 protein [Anaerolineae bacterium]
MPHNFYHVRRRWQSYSLACLFLCLLWWSRLQAVETLPLHNDEGLHLTRAVEVWSGHPFWAISDGKIINQWLIAAFYPQNAPVFVGRIATIFVALLGLAAGFALVRWLFGNVTTALMLVGGLWIGAVYLFFYERMAFSDAEAGALGLWALLASLRLAQRGRMSDALLAGLILGLALLFKFTAAPFAMGAALIILMAGQTSWSRRFILLGIVLVVVCVMFAIPLLYLTWRGQDFFSVAFAWIGAGGGAQGITLVANFQRLLLILRDLDATWWAALIFAGLVLAALLGNRSLRVLFFAALLPLLAILVLGNDAQSRHFVVTLPSLIVVAALGLAAAIGRLRSSWRPTAVGILLLSILVGFAPFAYQAYTDPAELPLPDLMRSQYVEDHSSGYGLREAVQAFPTTIQRPDLPIVASMFPDSCRRANFYAVAGLDMICADAPGQPVLEAAIEAHGAAYVLVEKGGLIGLDVSALPYAATRVAVYPRPGEEPANASVQLWLLEREQP